MSTTTMHVGMNGWVSEGAPSAIYNDTRGLRLDGTGADEKRAFLWFKLPFRPGEDVEVTEATLLFNLKTAWPGTTVMTARRIIETWSARTLSWDNVPTIGGGTPSVTINTGAIGDEVGIDVTGLVSGVAAGDVEFYGFRLEIDAGGPYSILSREAYNPENRPRMTVTWTETPDHPVDLSPAGGNVISKAKPHLGWHNPGFRGETTQARARVQVASNADMSIITFDTADVTGADGNGFIPLTETEIDLSDTSYGAPSIADGDDRWWRVKYEDDNGRRSVYSNIQKFTRRTKGTLEILNPVDGATLEDLSPEVLLDFTGATLAATALFVDVVNSDGQWEEIYRRPWHRSTDTSITIPVGFIKNTTDQYRLRVRAWDDEEREARPGDPMWVQAISEFTWDRNTAIAAVDSIEVTQHADGSPMVDITITDDDAPEYYCLVVDGQRVKNFARIDPEDVVIDVGEYRIVYGDAVPFVDTSYMVERVNFSGGEYKHSKNNPDDVVYASAPYGIWLYDPDDPNSDVVLEGPDHGADFEWGEVAETFYPAGTRAPVRLLQSTRGREGTVSGAIRSRPPIHARNYLSRLRQIWRSGRTMRLVMGEVNVPVVIGEPRDSPLNEPDPAYQVSFMAWQVDSFER